MPVLSSEVSLLLLKVSDVSAVIPVPLKEVSLPLYTFREVTKLLLLRFRERSAGKSQVLIVPSDVSRLLLRSSVVREV